jgi:flagellar hook assembly protein FlgD
VGVDAAEAPPALRLHAARPNPLSTDTSIGFDLPRQGHVRLDIYAADGSLVRRLVDDDVPVGRHVARWDCTDSGGLPAAGGVYLVRLDTGHEVRTNELVVAR